MTWLVIAVIVALALAPLLHFAPSKHQRRVAALRESAALAGLFVEFRSLPEPALPVAGRDDGQFIYYGKRLPPAPTAGPRSGCWVRDAQGWRSAGKLRSLPPALERLPAVVAVAGLDSGSCGIYWREQGQEVEIEAITEVLEAWSADLSG